MTEPIIGVYKITCLSSGKYYIGYSKNVKHRFTAHKSGLKRNKHQNQHLQMSYNKYNIENFTFDILHTCNTIDEAKELELKYLEDINIRPFLYNMHYNNSGGDTLTYHPNRTEIIEKITRSCRIMIDGLTPERRKEIFGQKIGEKNGMYGRTHTDEVKKRSSDMHKGNTYCKGKKASDETKHKMSIVASQRIGDANHFFGKRHSEETKQKLREAKTGTVPTNARNVIVEGISYESVTEAGRQIGVCTATIIHRIKSPNPKYVNYHYADTVSSEPMPASPLLFADDVDNC
jgi:group I intron endonuclease